MLSFIHKCLLTAKEVLFPKKCFGCGRPERYLCGACLKKLRDPDIFYPKNADFALTSFPYRAQAVKRALLRLKYHSAQDIAGNLAEVMAEDLSPYLKYSGHPVVCEIPMSGARKRKRGFNQAELLARHLAEIMNLEHRPLLVKTLDPKPQAEIKNRKDRLENIKGAFAFNKNFSVPQFAVVVDDIYTTGATMNEACRVLKKHGVKKIICAAVAR